MVMNGRAEAVLQELQRVEQEIGRATMLQGGNGAALVQQMLRRDALMRQLETPTTPLMPPPNVAVWPANGSIGFLTSGKNTFDLQEGLFYPADNNPPEQMSGRIRGGAQSCHWHPVFGNNWAYEVEPPNDAPKVPHGGRSITPFYMDFQHHTLTHVHMGKLHVYTPLPMAAFVEFSDDQHAPPVVPEGEFGPQQGRFSGVTTTDAFVAATIRPSSFNPSTGIGSSLTAARALAASLRGGPALTLSATVFPSQFALHTIWIIRETAGTNGALIRIQAAQAGVEADFFTVPETSPSGVFLAPNGFLRIVVEGQYVFQRLQVQSAVGGAAATLAGYSQCLVGL